MSRRRVRSRGGLAKGLLYDKYHEAEFARHNLRIYLPKLYRDESDLVVAVLCPADDQKPWTGWEWMAIHAQLTKKDGSNLMLSRFERAHVDGLFELHPRPQSRLWPRISTP